MSKDKKTYRTLSEQEIKDYLHGEITGSDAHQIERHLLNDAFDQEAMEGYESINEDAFKDISILKSKIGHKRSGMYFWPLAASIALLLVAGFSAWFFLDEFQTEQPIALNQDSKPIEADAPTPEPELSQIEVRESLVEEDVNATEDLEADDEIVQSMAEPYVSEIEIIADIPEDIEPVSEEFLAIENADAGVESLDMQMLLADEEPLPAEVLKEEEDVSTRLYSKKVSEVAPAARSSAYMARPDSKKLTVKGQVTDEMGDPLPGVTILVKGKSKGAITDVDGNYKLETEREDVLQYSFIGFESVESPVGGRTEINMELDADVSSLDEVVVVGYGAEIEAIGYEPAEPHGGMSNYKTYLDNNLVYPEAAHQNKIEGRVVLKLTITEKGDIDDVELRRSVGYGCDEEAIRLVREGPKWKAAIRDGVPVESTVRVRIKFERD